MKTVLSAFLSASLLITTTVASVAEPNNTVTYMDVASKHCAAEWTGVIKLDPDAWEKISEVVKLEIGSDFWAKHLANKIGLTHIDPERNVPEMDAATTEAFRKFQTVSIAIAEYIGVFVGLSVTTNQNPEYFDLASAKFDVMMCLFPTEAELDLIVDFSKTVTNASDEDIRRSLFEGFDQFECMQFAKASEAIFSVESFPFDYKATTEANMKTCN